jgi:hypothetical protein
MSKHLDISRTRQGAYLIGQSSGVQFGMGASFFIYQRADTWDYQREQSGQNRYRN